MPSTSSTGTNDHAIAIGKMNRQTLIDHLQNFDPGFKLDFTEAFLATKTIEQLKHILLAAHLQAKQRGTLATTLAKAT